MTTTEQPTAVVRRVDMSVPHGASAARRVSEAELLYGHQGSGLEMRPCVCGGYVHADPERPALGVSAHNYSPRHQAWRVWHGEDQ